MKTIGALVLALVLVGCGGDEGPGEISGGAAGTTGGAGMAAGASGSQAGAQAGSSGAAGTSSAAGSAAGEGGAGDGGSSAGTSGGAGASAGAGGSAQAGSSGAAGSAATSYPACPAKTHYSDCYNPTTQADRKKDGFICSPCSADGKANPVGCITDGVAGPARLCVRDCSECS